MPFDHPLCVLFSSGTTGLPKAIVHGHGGIILEAYKNHVLSWDLGPGDRLMWFTTTAWMMWNALVSTLLTGASIVCLDGNPMWPDLDAQWRIAEDVQPTMMGLGPAFVMTCVKQGKQPAATYDLTSLRMLCAAGSPLPTEGFVWLHEQFGSHAPVYVGSGGTDVCTGLVQGYPIVPVYAGEISAKCLGVAAYAFDEDGNSVVGELGELVIVEPMPSMPVRFWGDDADMTRYRGTYFEQYPGVMRFGDWVRFSERGTAVVTGRSDATLNRGGVRIGTAEIYRVVEQLDEVADSLVVHIEDPSGGLGELILFVQPAPDADDPTKTVEIDDALRSTIGAAIRNALSPRHVPDRILAVSGVPRNLTGKKLEVPGQAGVAGRRRRHGRVPPGDGRSRPPSTASSTRSPAADVTYRDHRHRCDRGELGGPVRGARQRGRGERSASRRRGRPPPRRRGVLAVAGAPGSRRRRRLTRPGDGREVGGRCRRRSVVRAGERTRAPRTEARPVRRDRRRRRSRRGDRFEFVRADADPTPAGLRAPPGTGAGRASVQPAAPDPARRGRRR